MEGSMTLRHIRVPEALLLPLVLLMAAAAGCGGGGSIEGAPACQSGLIRVEGTVDNAPVSIADPTNDYTLDNLDSPPYFSVGSMEQPALYLTWASSVINGSVTPIATGMLRNGDQVLCAGAGQIVTEENSVSFQLSSLSISSSGTCPGDQPVTGLVTGCVDITQNFGP
jgi:hypothetical protein